MIKSGDSASNLNVNEPSDGENNEEDKLVNTLSSIRNGLLDLKRILED